MGKMDFYVRSKKMKAVKVFIIFLGILLLCVIISFALYKSLRGSLPPLERAKKILADAPLIDGAVDQNSCIGMGQTQGTLSSMAQTVGLKAKNVNAKNVNVYQGYNRERNRKIRSNVHNCERYFVGRTAIIKDIQSSIQVDKKRVIVLYGFGGMGKSQIVKKWAEEYIDNYKYIYSLDASDESSLQESFRSLAQSVGLDVPKGVLSTENISTIYRSFGGTSSKGVLIFANVSPATTGTGLMLEKYLPPKELAKRVVIIVTSRVGGNTWSKLCESEFIRCIPVSSLDEDESYACFLKYLRLKGDIDEEIKQKIMLLVKRHDGYPLGLSILGKSISSYVEDSLPASGDLHGIVRALSDLLKEESLETLSTEYLRSEAVTIVYNATIEAIRILKAGEDAIKLLQYLACLQPDSVKVGLLKDIYKHLCFSPQLNANVEDQNPLNRQLDLSSVALERFCLATVEIPAGKHQADKIRLEKVVHSLMNFRNRECETLREENMLKLIQISQFFEQNHPQPEFLPHIRFVSENLVALEANFMTARCAVLLYWKLLEEYVTRNPTTTDLSYCLQLLGNVNSLGCYLKDDDHIWIQLAESVTGWLGQPQDDFHGFDFQKQIQMIIPEKFNQHWIPKCCIDLLSISVPQNQIQIEC